MTFKAFIQNLFHYICGVEAGSGALKHGAVSRSHRSHQRRHGQIKGIIPRRHDQYDSIGLAVYIINRGKCPHTPPHPPGSAPFFTCFSAVSISLYTIATSVINASVLYFPKSKYRASRILSSFCRIAYFNFFNCRIRNVMSFVWSVWKNSRCFSTIFSTMFLSILS